MLQLRDVFSDDGSWYLERPINAFLIYADQHILKTIFHKKII